MATFNGFCYFQCLCCVTVQSGSSSNAQYVLSGQIVNLFGFGANFQVYSNGTVILSIGNFGMPAQNERMYRG